MTAVAVMGISACSSSDKPAKPTAPFEQNGKSPEGKHDVYQGPLQVSYQAVQQSPNRSGCDKKLSGIQSTLIEALDKKRSFIQQNSQLQKNHPEAYIPFQKSYLVNTPKRAAKKGWQDEPYSWAHVYDYYLKNADSTAPEVWLSMDAYVRSLVTEDRKRVIFGHNLGLSHEHIEMLSEFKETVEACKTNTRCVQPRFSDAQLTMISQVPAYSYFKKEIDKAYFDKDKRKYITKLSQRISDDLEFHHDNHNKSISHRKVYGKHEYTIPIDSTGYSLEEQSTLENSITSIWNNENNSVNISWQKPYQGIFYFIFDLTPNNRSYVNFDLHEIRIYALTAVRTIAHEFGHVLGLDDHYYTLWDEQNCEYHQQTNEEDIMSSSESGDVTESEWEFLSNQYGYR